MPPIYSGSLIVIMAVAAMALCFGYPTLLNKKKKKNEDGNTLKNHTIAVHSTRVTSLYAFSS